MSQSTVAGVLLLLLPVCFNLFFYLLGKRFEYPDILRRPVDEVLHRFNDGGAGLRLMWLGFMLTAVLFAPVVVLLHGVLAIDASPLLNVATTLGLLAAVVQFLGLARWPFLVPYLARTYQDPASGAATREAVAVVFESFNRYAGVGIGEHLGYLFTGLWTSLTGVVITQGTLPDWIGIVGVIVGLGIVTGSLEFVGPFEQHGLKLAGTIIPIAYVVWSLWLIAVGIALLT
jgi:hypothetical protein